MTGFFLPVRMLITSGLILLTVLPELNGAAELPSGSPLPAGTLGQTYYRRSHPVPLDKHPRTGMLAVRNQQNLPLLSVPEMGGFRMQSGVWLFESSRPLDFGASHIVRVEARTNQQEVEPTEVRFVRLIPGRIVYLDF